MPTNPFECLPDEALEALIRDARDTLTERRRGVSPRTLASFLDLESANFMGLGMSLRELVATHQVERNLRSFGQQGRTEKRRRIELVIRLSVELTEILKVTHFSTALARQAIADVLEGDWAGVKVWADVFTFSEEPPHRRDLPHAAPAFKHFHEILVEALATAPKPEAPATNPS